MRPESVLADMTVKNTTHTTMWEILVPTLPGGLRARHGEDQGADTGAKALATQGWGSRGHTPAAVRDAPRPAPRDTCMPARTDSLRTDTGHPCGRRTDARPHR